MSDNERISVFQDAADHATDQGNETQRVLAGQLILVATTIVTISAAFMGGSHDSNFGFHSRIALITSWIAFILSVMLGIYGLIRDAQFFQDWQIYFFSIGDQIGKGETEEKAREISKALKPKGTSPIWPLYAQVALLCFGIMAFLALIIHLQLVP